MGPTLICPGKRCLHAALAAASNCLACCPARLLHPVPVPCDSPAPPHRAASQGFIFPTFNSFYWIGLRTQSWPNFIFIDRLDGGSYSNWGTMLDPLLDEPNNLNNNEFCAGANFTQLKGSTWGWSDELCTHKAAFVCKIRRECPHSCAWLSHAGLCCMQVHDACELAGVLLVANNLSQTEAQCAAQ